MTKKPAAITRGAASETPAMMVRTPNNRADVNARPINGQNRAGGRPHGQSLGWLGSFGSPPPLLLGTLLQESATGAPAVPLSPSTHSASTHSSKPQGKIGVSSGKSLRQVPLESGVTSSLNSGKLF